MRAARTPPGKEALTGRNLRAGRGRGNGIGTKWHPGRTRRPGKLTSLGKKGEVLGPFGSRRKTNRRVSDSDSKSRHASGGVLLEDDHAEILRLEDVLEDRREGRRLRLRSSMRGGELVTVTASETPDTMVTSAVVFFPSVTMTFSRVTDAKPLAIAAMT